MLTDAIIRREFERVLQPSEDRPLYFRITPAKFDLAAVFLAFGGIVRQFRFAEEDRLGGIETFAARYVQPVAATIAKEREMRVRESARLARQRAFKAANDAAREENAS